MHLLQLEPFPSCTSIKFELAQAFLILFLTIDVSFILDVEVQHYNIFYLFLRKVGGLRHH